MSASRRGKGTPQLELPHFELNRLRSLIKALAYGGRQTLSGGSRSVQSVAPADAQAMIAEVAEELTDLITDANVGIIDLANPPEIEDEELDEEQPSITKQMIDLCQRASGRLSAIVRERDPAAEGAPAADAATTTDDGGLFN